MAFADLICVIFILLNSSVEAITDGELDNNNHPNVGLLLQYNANKQPIARCSCVLISEQIILTAGRCTDKDAEYATVWFDSDVENGIPDNGYPMYAGGDVWGRVYTHPQYDMDAFWRHDLGVVVIDRKSKDFKMPSVFGKLPTLGQFDSLQTGLETKFDNVGYGLQEISPVYIEALRIRMISTSWLIQKENVWTNNIGEGGDSLWILSNNHVHGGGTCHGDLGGPNFIHGTHTVAALTSFTNRHGNCVGVAGVYRIDEADDLNWLYGTFGQLINGKLKVPQGPKEKQNTNGIISQSDADADTDTDAYAGAIANDANDAAPDMFGIEDATPAETYSILTVIIIAGIVILVVLTWGVYQYTQKRKALKELNQIEENQNNNECEIDEKPLYDAEVTDVIITQSRD